MLVKRDTNSRGILYVFRNLRGKFMILFAAPWEPFSGAQNFYLFCNFLIIRKRVRKHFLRAQYYLPNKVFIFPCYRSCYCRHYCLFLYGFFESVSKFLLLFFFSLLPEHLYLLSFKGEIKLLKKLKSCLIVWRARKRVMVYTV